MGRGSWKSYCLVSALWALHFGCQRNRHYNNDSRSGAAIGRCWMPADWAVQSHSLPPGKKNGSICAADRSPAAGVLRKRLERLSGYGSSLVLGAAQCQLQKVSCLLNIDHTSPLAASIEQNTPKMQADSGQHRPLHLLRGYEMEHTRSSSVGMLSMLCGAYIRNAPTGERAPCQKL